MTRLAQGCGGRRDAGDSSAEANGETLLGDLARDCSLADADMKPHCDKVLAWLRSRNVEVPTHEW